MADRMSPAGIVMFDAALDSETALLETATGWVASLAASFAFSVPFGCCT